MKTKFFPYTLTIGMIVKNDASRLRTCLEGLAPLRNAISCELILTDLGSTDGTQEIAKEYADVFLEHEWNEDYSKARNTGVAASKGRWFFYVDADFQFDESILDISAFLSDKKQSKIYNSATVTLENHVLQPEGSDTLTSSSYQIQRGLLVNFSGGKRFFQGTTHESIPTHGVAYPLKTLISRSVPQETEEERAKNRNLLQAQLHQNPEDLTHYIQLTQELTDPEQKRHVFQAGLAKSKTLPTSNKDNVLWTAMLHSRYLLFALQEEDWDLFSTLQKEWDNPFPRSIIDLNVQGMILSASLKQQEQDELLQGFSSYQDLFYQLKKTPDQLFSMIESYSYARDPFFYSVESNAIRCAVAYHMPHLAKEWMAQSDTYSFVHSNKTRAHLPNFCECAMATEQFSLIRKAYDYLTAHSSPSDFDAFLETVQSLYQPLPSYQQELFAQAMDGVALSFLPDDSDTPAYTSITLPSSQEPSPEPETHSVPEPESTQLPSLHTLKETLLTFLQQGDLPSATALLPSALARFPEDATLQALHSKLGL